MFPKPEIIDEKTKFAFCQNRPYVYIASGNTLYVYNHKDNTVKTLRDDFGRPIRDIAVCPTNYERLGISGGWHGILWQVRESGGFEV